MVVVVAVVVVVGGGVVAVGDGESIRNGESPIKDKKRDEDLNSVLKKITYPKSHRFYELILDNWEKLNP